MLKTYWPTMVIVFLLSLSFMLPIHYALISHVPKVVLVTVQMLLMIVSVQFFAASFRGVFNNYYISSLVSLSKAKGRLLIRVFAAMVFMLHMLPLVVVQYALITPIDVMSFGSLVALALVIYMQLWLQILYYFLLPGMSQLWLSLLVLPMVLPVLLGFSYVVSGASNDVFYVFIELMLAVCLFFTVFIPFLVQHILSIKKGY